MPAAHHIADVLAKVASVEVTGDGALTVRHDGTFASLRTVTIADGLELISLTQALAWDLVPDAELRKSVAAQASRTMLGTVTLVEHPDGGLDAERADVVLRYNFPTSVALCPPSVLDTPRTCRTVRWCDSPQKTHEPQPLRQPTPPPRGR